MKQQPWIYVDVDGTLVVRGNPNLVLIDWLKNKKLEGFNLVLWSMAGQEHAQDAANALGITHLFEAILCKPGYLIDDKGWMWAKETKCLYNFE